MRWNYTGCATLPMACLGSRSRGSRELEPCSSGVLSMDRLHSGLQSMSRDTHCGSRNCCSGHNQAAPWNEVIWGTWLMGSPGHAGPQRGWYQLVSMNLEAQTPNAQLVTGFLHDLKEGSKCWLSCKVFSERLWLYHMSWGCEKPLLTKVACFLWWDEEKTQQSKRSLAATVCSCNGQQASTAWKSVLRRFSCSCATPSFLLCLLHVKNEHGKILRKWQRHLHSH